MPHQILYESILCHMWHQPQWKKKQTVFSKQSNSTHKLLIMGSSHCHCEKANGEVHPSANFSTELNNSLDIHQYPLPVPEDLFTKLIGGICFAKIDLAHAYLQVEVDAESKNLFTINTCKDLFQFNCLLFGSRHLQQYYNKQWMLCSQN